MERNILAVGDVVAPAGVKYCKAALPRLRRELSVDFCVVNGENAAVLGMLPAQAEELLSAGADVITMGNHTWGRRELVPYLERSREVLRPANLPQQQPGRGWGVFETPFGDVAVIDLIGRCGMDYTPDNPFQLVERILRKIQTKLILVELHAEATSEKLAMGRMLDGQVQALASAMIDADEVVKQLRIQPKFIADSQWDYLQKLTDRVYKGASKRLVLRFPQLTPADSQLCMLIRLHFSNAQIATLIAVSPASVSQQKFRLKKRMMQADGRLFADGETLDTVVCQV